MKNTSPSPRRAARPRDAATLVLVRSQGGKAAVLMGQRHGGLEFLPDHYVFPGGRLERADYHAAPARPLNHRVADLLGRSAATPRKAQALALAAVRETFEETGLIIGRPMAAPRRIPKSWARFYETGQGPDLYALDYITRAVTPPFRNRRFNARFFLADGERTSGKINGSGELLHIEWIPIARAKLLKLSGITKIVLDTVEEILSAPEDWRRRGTVPAYRVLHGKRVVEHE